MTGGTAGGTVAMTGIAMMTSRQVQGVGVAAAYGGQEAVVRIDMVLVMKADIVNHPIPGKLGSCARLDACLSWHCLQYCTNCDLI